MFKRSTPAASRPFGSEAEYDAQIASIRREIALLSPASEDYAQWKAYHEGQIVIMEEARQIARNFEKSQARAARNALLPLAFVALSAMYMLFGAWRHFFS